mgnify:FL=1
MGSSPHTRGALIEDGKLVRYRGIIPAYAGSTGPDGRSGCESRDHPRIRGEHAIPSTYAVGAGGSSPHTRGALRRRAERHRVGGIIPAYAGSTVGSADSETASWDHPRIRGEHSKFSVTFGSLMGSSPHTRGAPSAQRIHDLPFGIIPAYAGST